MSVGSNACCDNTGSLGFFQSRNPCKVFSVWVGAREKSAEKRSKNMFANSVLRLTRKTSPSTAYMRTINSSDFENLEKSSASRKLLDKMDETRSRVVTTDSVATVETLQHQLRTKKEQRRTCIIKWFYFQNRLTDNIIRSRCLNQLTIEEQIL